MRDCSNNVGAAEDAIAAGATVLAAGGLVVYPTETVYGLGADAGSAGALERLVALKVRAPGKPIAVVVSDVAMLRGLVRDIPPLAVRLMQQFWPGPLTIVMHASPTVSRLLTGDDDGIGARISSHPSATALVRALGRPLTAPSANPAGAPPPVRLDAARSYFGTAVDYYLDGGPLPGEPPSTVVDVRGALRVLREGTIAPAALLAALRS